jgi:site-specific DNA-methyltransferase (adenine-specific)
MRCRNDRSKAMIELHNVDCMEYLATLEDNAFELAIVDPPYGIDITNQSQGRGGGVAKKIDYAKKDWDKNAPTEEYFTELERVSNNQIIWGANHFRARNSSCWIVWDKVNGATDFADAELAYTSFTTAVRVFRFKWAGMLQGDMKNKEQRIHPTQKPVKLYEWLLMNYAKEGDRILDTHLGSNSIAIACHNLGFDLVGCELDTDYFNAAKKRLQQHQSQLRIPMT